MNFGEAIQAGFRNYINFETRACRSEYWYWTLFVFIIGFVLGYLEAIMGLVSDSGYGLFSSIFSLATFIPGIAISFRRLHDLDKSGWWLLLMLVPLVGWVVLIYWNCTRGTDGANRFGNDPLDPSNDDMIAPASA